MKYVLSAVLVGIAALGATPVLAQTTGVAKAASNDVVAGMPRVLDGMSPVWGETRKPTKGSGSSMSPVMAMAASQRADIDRIRATMGGSSYMPTVECASNVNVGPTQPTNHSYIGNETYVGNLTVVNGGACAAMKNKLQ